ncbi:hypothetical protein BJ546DRAFT_952148 [Cryomyces antarcticus]
MLISSLKRTASCMIIQKICYGVNGALGACQIVVRLQGQDNTVRETKCKCSPDKVLIDGFHTTLGYSNNVKAIVALGYKTPSNARVTAPIVLLLVVTTTNSLS